MKDVIDGKLPFSEFLKSHPEFVQEQAERGYTLYSHGKYDKALEVFMGLEVILPDHAYPKMAIAAIRYAEENYDEAIKLLDQAIERDAKWGAPLVTRGEIYLRLGDLKNAVADLEKAVALDPESKLPETKHARLLAAATLASMRAARAAQVGDAPGTPTAGPAAAPGPASAPAAASAPAKKK